MVTSTMTFEEELASMLTAATAALTSAGVEFDEKETEKLLRDQLTLARGETPSPIKNEPVPEPEPEVLELTDTDEATEAYWYEPQKDSDFLEYFVKGRLAGRVEGQVIITGHSGQGKTEGVIRLFDRLNVPLNIINCASITTIEKWIGHKEVDHAGTRFVMSEFLRMVEALGADHTYPDGQMGYEPGGILLDELTRLHATYHNVLYPLFDGQERIFVPELHTYIKRHPSVMFLATANIGGRYSGTHQLDAAMRERFAYTIERDFPPADEETRILTTRTHVAEEKAKQLVDIANKTRAKLEQGDLSMAISTRTLIFAAQLVASGASIIRSLELTALPHFTKDGGSASERAMVMNIVKGKVV